MNVTQLRYADELNYRLYDKKALASRYGITTQALCKWYPSIGIISPSRGSVFSDRDIERCDLFFIATRIYKLTQAEYKTRAIASGGFIRYFEKQHPSLTFLEYLEVHLGQDWQDCPIVQDTIKRLKAKNDSSSRRSRTAEPESRAADPDLSDSRN